MTTTDEDKIFAIRHTISYLQAINFINESQMQICYDSKEVYKRLVFSSSWQEMYLSLTCIQMSYKMTWLDWLVVFAMFSKTYSDFANYINCDIDIYVILDAIDNSSFLDDVIKHTKILRYLSTTTSALYSLNHRQSSKAILSYIFNKFPQLAVHSANISKNKIIGKFQRLTLDEAKTIYQEYQDFHKNTIHR